MWYRVDLNGSSRVVHPGLTHKSRSGESRLGCCLDKWRNPFTRGMRVPQELGLAINTHANPCVDRRRRSGGAVADREPLFAPPISILNQIEDATVGDDFGLRGAMSPNQIAFLPVTDGHQCNDDETE